MEEPTLELVFRVSKALTFETGGVFGCGLR